MLLQSEVLIRKDTVAIKHLYVSNITQKACCIAAPLVGSAGQVTFCALRQSASGLSEQSSGGRRLALPLQQTAESLQATRTHPMHSAFGTKALLAVHHLNLNILHACGLWSHTTASRTAAALAHAALRSMRLSHAPQQRAARRLCRSA